MSGVDSISRAPLDNTTGLNSQKAPDSSASIQATQVKVSQSQTTDITIVTAEGDTVTLSSSKSAELSCATYNAQGKVGDSLGRSSGMSAELHRTSAFSITVDGDLNKEELKDIRSAIRTIQKVAKDVQKGHDEKAAARTAKLANLGQIGSIDADLEFSREVSVTQVSAQSEATANPETAATPESTEGTSAPAQSPAPTSSTPSATVATATASTHLSVLIQTQANPTSGTAPDAPTPGRWWFPSQDLWNSLQPKTDAGIQSAPTEAAETPVTA